MARSRDVRHHRHSVTKIMDFAYGHRLINYDGKCRFLHGHNGILEVDIAADTLDDCGMVVDFGDVKDLVKGWVDENLDHRMILCRDDPMAEALAEMGEPVYLMPANPTAENIAKHIFEQAKGMGLNIVEARLWETPSSYATYREGG